LQLQRPSGQLRHAVQNVQVGGKVEVVGDDFGTAVVVLHRRQCQLKQVERRRVGHNHLIGVGTDELADFAANLGLKLNPSLIPAANEPLAPLTCYQVLRQLGTFLRQAAQRVAVQVNQIGIINDKPFPEMGQRVLGVELLGIGRVGDLRHVRP